MDFKKKIKKPETKSCWTKPNKTAVELNFK